MRFVRLALLTAALTAAPAAAQQAATGGGNLGAASQATGTTSTGSSTTTTQSTGSGDTSTTTTTVAPRITGADITGTTSATAATGGGVATSNFLGATYSNPYYQGLFSNSTGTPGQFGAPLYGTSTGTTTSSTGAWAATGATSRTTTTGGANPFGTSASQTGRGGAAGQLGGGQLGGAGVSTQFGGQLVPLPRNIAYSAVLRFPAPQVAPAQRLADVQTVLARSSMLSSPAGVSVVQDGAVFVLRGNVASEDEFRLAENMIRMTPGVREVRNELKYPVQ